MKIHRKADNLLKNYEGKVFVKKKLSGKSKENLAKTDLTNKVEEFLIDNFSYKEPKRHYTINDDFTVDITLAGNQTLDLSPFGDIDTSGKSVEEILGFKIKNLKGNYYVHEINSLESLEGSPDNVDGVVKLESLSDLDSIEGIPNPTGRLTLSGLSKIQTLDGLPEYLHSAVVEIGVCPKLKTLKSDCKKTRRKIVLYRLRGLKSLEGLPECSTLEISTCLSLKSLKGTAKKYKSVLISGCRHLDSLKSDIEEVTVLMDVLNSNGVSPNMKFVDYLPKKIDTFRVSPNLAVEIAPTVDIFIKALGKIAKDSGVEIKSIVT